jgi:hypothetical protein
MENCPLCPASYARKREVLCHFKRNHLEEWWPYCRSCGKALSVGVHRHFLGVSYCSRACEYVGRLLGHHCDSRYELEARRVVCALFPHPYVERVEAEIGEEDDRRARRHRERPADDTKAFWIRALVYPRQPDPRGRSRARGRSKGRREHAWRRVVGELYGWRCALCGCTTSLEAHHKASYKRYPELRREPRNGVLLCHHCHRGYIHSLRGAALRLEWEREVLRSYTRTVADAQASARKEFLESAARGMGIRTCAEVREGKASRTGAQVHQPRSVQPRDGDQ